jgi:outer membrane PBP1 activator LpoA protein
MKTISMTFFLLIAISLTTLSGCGSNPIAQSKQHKDHQIISYIPSSIDTLLTEAEQTQSNTNADMALSGISELLAQRSISQAEEKLANLEIRALSPKQQLLYTLLKGSILYAQQRYTEALALYRDPALPIFINTSSEKLQWQYALELANLTASSGDLPASIRILVTTQNLKLGAEQHRQLQSIIWQQLIHIDLQGFRRLQKPQPSRVLSGWIKLASIARQHRQPLKQRLSALEGWLQAWPKHSANQIAYHLSQIWHENFQNSPQHIALLLPLSGPLASSGKAVRDGFLAAYYKHLQTLPKLTILDTAVDDIKLVYEKAVRDGAKIIIGPLTKSRLRSLIKHSPDNPIPTLALNQVKEDLGPPWLKQFALAPTTEIEQIVNQALFHNPGNALLIYPADNRGREQGKILRETWQAGNNQVVANVEYTNQRAFSDQIKNSLNINFSERRAESLKNLIATTSEFSPRRRQDIDTVFLLVNKAEDARSLKPLLDFHYAGDLPIYSTSNIFEGEELASRDRDINGVIFVDIPWVFDKSSTEQKDLKKSQLWQSNNNRLYALGADAWYLRTQLGTLDKDNNYYRGHTGTLHLDNAGVMIRDLMIGEFYKGIPRIKTAAIPTK